LRDEVELAPPVAEPKPGNWMVVHCTNVRFTRVALFSEPNLQSEDYKVCRNGSTVVFIEKQVHDSVTWYKVESVGDRAVYYVRPLHLIMPDAEHRKYGRELLKALAAPNIPFGATYIPNAADEERMRSCENDIKVAGLYD